MNVLTHELKYSLRGLLKSPGFTLTAVLCLAVGIGGTTAMFSVVHAVLLRPLPFSDPDRLVVLKSACPVQSLDDEGVSQLDFLDWKQQTQSFSHMAAYEWRELDLVMEAGFARLQGLQVTTEFFETLGLQPLLGRTFSPHEHTTNERLLVLGHAAFRNHFSAHPQAIGKRVEVGSWSTTEVGTKPFHIVGVMKPGVPFLPAEALTNEHGVSINQPVDFWMPLAFDSNSKRRGRWFMEVVARLKEGVTIEQAQAEMETIAHRLEATYPDTNEGWTIRVLPLRERVLGNVRPAMTALLGVVGCVLAIACANVAHLLLIRAAGREREMATRAALGAGPLRLFRQLLIESLLLTTIGGLFGLLAAIWIRDVIVSLAPRDLPRLPDVAINTVVLAFSAVVLVVIAVVLGLIPALRVTLSDLNGLLKSAGNATTRRSKLSQSLVVAEVCLALVLLVGAGLMIKSFWRLMHVDPGFEPRQLLTMTISLPKAQHEWKHNSVFCNEVVERIGNLPGVESAAAIRGLPMGGTNIPARVRLEAQPQGRYEDYPKVRICVVTSDYFGAAGIPLLRGRLFDDGDSIGEIGWAGVTVINEAMAQRCWPNENPIGKRFAIPADLQDAPWINVIGVVGNVKYQGLDRQVTPTIYYTERLFPQAEITLLARTSHEPLNLVSAVRREVRAVDEGAFITDVKTMDRVVSDSQAHRRFTLYVLTAFAIVALGLAAAGIYGVTTYSVAQRTREFGIRLALGGQPSDIIRLILHQCLILIMLGVAFGWVIASAATHVLSTSLYAVSRTDASTFTSAVVLLVAVAMLACYLAARRATKIHPMVALRCE